MTTVRFEGLMGLHATPRPRRQFVSSNESARTTSVSDGVSSLPFSRPAYTTAAARRVREFITGRAVPVEEAPFRLLVWLYLVGRACQRAG